MLDEVWRKAGVAVQHEVVVVATKNDRVEHDATLKKKLDDAIAKGFERQVQQPWFQKARSKSSILVSGRHVSFPTASFPTL